ncbi:MAG: hypothetical protein JXB24_06315 [Bacteroidales bacterium]|nr:hypothetical protein [Bacteroidales bacterium]
MKKTYFILMLFVCFFYCSSSQKLTNVYKSPKLNTIQRIAVAPFEDAPGILAKGSGKVVADVMVTQLLTLNKYQVIERSQLQKVLSEHNLSQSGVIDAVTAQEVGKILGVDAVIIGSVTEYQMKKGHVPLYVTNIQTRGYTVGASARIVSVESGEILFSSTAVDNGSSYNEASEKVCARITSQF